MATQSAAPPNPTDENPDNPEAVQPIIKDHQDAKAEATKENLASVFTDTEPMREEQVQNAVKFLSHPKVRGSPVIYRRSFLERKGLTKEEIDEAFRRVPDPSPTVQTTQPAVTIQDGLLKPSSNAQPQAPTQALEPAAAAPAGSISKMGTLTPSRFHWSQALLAVGFLAISGTGTAVIFKNAIVPRLKSWIRKVVLEEENDLVKKTISKPSLAEEAAAAAKSAATAAADVARASQEMLISKTEEKRYFGELISLLDVQVQEMKSMSNSIRKLEGKIKILGQEDNRVSVTSSRPSYANGKADFDLQSARSLSPPASVEPSTAPHPKSYMEPWEVMQLQNSSSHVLQAQENRDNGLVNQLNGDSSIPRWKQQNDRIKEIETDDESKTRFYGVQTNELPVQRSWVPPQPPPVAMPEAAAAIRQPKKAQFQKEQLRDDQLLARSSEITDELQRITKISESGGVMEVNGGNPTLTTSEIQKEDDNSYIEA